MEAMATAAAAGAGGREIDFFDRVLALRESGEHPVVSRLVEQLAFAVMTRRQVDPIVQLLDRLAKPGLPVWISQAALRGASAVHAANDPVRLEQKPAFAAIVAGTSDPVLAELGPRLIEQISWPNDGRVQRADVRPLTAAERSLFELGKVQYGLICAACHQADGMGLTGVAPPLAGSEWTIGDPRIPTEVIIHGLAGPIEVRGQRWDMLMPGLGAVPGVLDDEKIAGIVTYIRREWGNKATPISSEEVKRIRAQSAGRTNPWTSQELKALAPDGGSRMPNR